MNVDNIKDIQELYENNRNPENAKKMAAYMKNKFAFMGIPAPLRNNLFKDIQNNLGGINIIDIEPLVYKLWALPEREYQYLAIALILKVKRQLNPSHLEFILELITNKSWWDSIDTLAPHFVGSILSEHPDLRDEYIPIWIKSENIWINRTAILFQLKYKTETDFSLLKSIIDALKNKNEFFVKKSIGWALREYSKTNADLVKEYVQSANLQSLSKKEALKIINKN